LRSDGALNTIVVDVDATIFEESAKLGFPGQTIANGFGEFGFARDA